MFEWRRRGSNPQPLPCKGSALPIELRPHGKKGHTPILSDPPSPAKGSSEVRWLAALIIVAAMTCAAIGGLQMRVFGKVSRGRSNYGWYNLIGQVAPNLPE